MSHEHEVSHVRVADCMHAGIVSCPPGAPFSEVARAMGDHRVHAVAVADITHGRLGHLAHRLHMD